MKNKSLQLLFVAAIIAIAYAACKKPDELPQVLGPRSEYFPLELNRSIVYNVDSTIWDDTFCVKEFRSHQIMYTVSDTFTDAQGRLSYRIDTRIRRNPGDEWMTHKVMYATNTGAVVEFSYEGLNFIKLSFPIANGNSWKGNQYIQTDDPEYAYFDNWDYTYANVGHPYVTADVKYDKTITVEHIDSKLNDPDIFPNDTAARTYSREVFASGIGMVYREYYHWTYDPKTTKCRKGKGVVMSAVDNW